MSPSLVGSADCILLVKNIPHHFTESNLLERCQSIGHPCIALHSQPESGGCYTVKLLAPSPEAIQQLSTMIDGMRSDQTWISTEVRPWATLSSSERTQYPAHVLLDVAMLQSLRLSLMQPKKIQDLDRQVADLKVELAGYQHSSGTNGSREKIQVFKLGNEFLRAAKATSPTAYEASTNILNNITALRNVMSNPDSPPTVLQITSAVSACFAPLFQHINSTHQTLLATQKVLEVIKDELTTVKATNEGLQQQASQFSFDHLSSHTLSAANLQSEIEGLKKEISEEQARLTATRQESKKLKAQIVELRGKVGSFRENIRKSEETHSNPTHNGSFEPPDVSMGDSTASSHLEIQVLVREQKLLTRALEGEKNRRLGVELELADLKAEYELQEKMMFDWFLESVRLTNGEEYLRQLKTLKEIRPMPPSRTHDSRDSRDSFYRLLG